jgi:hypothetical protein
LDVAGKGLDAAKGTPGPTADPVGKGLDVAGKGLDAAKGSPDAPADKGDPDAPDEPDDPFDLDKDLSRSIDKDLVANITAKSVTTMGKGLTESEKAAQARGLEAINALPANMQAQFSQFTTGCPVFRV